MSSVGQTKRQEIVCLQTPFLFDTLSHPTKMKFVAALFLFVNSATAFSLSSPAFAAPTTSSTQLMGEFGASSTSFYTTTEKKDSYESLDDVLSNKCSDPKVRHVIKDMLNVCAEITEALRTALVTVEGSMNDFGDAQLSVDVSNALSIRCDSVAEKSLSLAIISIPILTQHR
jgi:hypothetical protein